MNNINIFFYIFIINYICIFGASSHPVPSFPCLSGAYTTGEHTSEHLFSYKPLKQRTTSVEKHVIPVSRSSVPYEAFSQPQTINTLIPMSQLARHTAVDHSKPCGPTGVTYEYTIESTPTINNPTISESLLPIEVEEPAVEAQVIKMPEQPTETETLEVESSPVVIEAPPSIIETRSMNLQPIIIQSPQPVKPRTIELPVMKSNDYYQPQMITNPGTVEDQSIFRYDTPTYEYNYEIPQRQISIGQKSRYRSNGVTLKSMVHHKPCTCFK